jgi:hypothetical protein
VNIWIAAALWSWMTLGIMRLPIPRKHCPLVRNVGSHPEKVRLPGFDDLGAVVMDQPQEHVLREVIEVRCRNPPARTEPAAQRLSPLAEPGRQGLL